MIQESQMTLSLFEKPEVLERIRTRKALENDHMGYWPGKMDLEQIRLFNRPFDISYLLGIGNKMAVTSTIIKDGFIIYLCI